MKNYLLISEFLTPFDEKFHTFLASCKYDIALKKLFQ